MNVDYIIVGCGLAGIAFCEQLIEANRSFVVFDNNSQVSSTVAGGLYNPVVLKRFTRVWKSEEQMELALPMYHNIENRLCIKLDHKLPVLRLFKSFEEQNDWFAASDKVGLTRWLSTSLIKNQNNCIEANFGFGEVLDTGRIDSTLLIKTYKKDLIEKNSFYSEEFNYSKLSFQQNKLRYKEIFAKNIVFAEGFGLKQNLFFNYLPLNGTKGELLIINAPDLKIDYVLKSSVFLIPIGDDNYIVGATYEWKDKTNRTTRKAREELLNKLTTFLKCDFKVVRQKAGIRPTVIDRRPLVGVHSQYKNMFILNGLGTRGVLIAPYISKQLFNLIEKKKPLDKEININRFN